MYYGATEGCFCVETFGDGEVAVGVCAFSG